MTKTKKNLATHVRMCPLSDGTVKYWKWLPDVEDYSPRPMKPADALRSIANGATMEIALLDPDEEAKKERRHCNVYEAMDIQFFKS